MADFFSLLGVVCIVLYIYVALVAGRTERARGSAWPRIVKQALLWPKSAFHSVRDNG